MTKFKRKFQVGQRYGRLVVTGFDHVKMCGRHKRIQLKVLCDCGKSAVVGLMHLKSGMTQSCGCLQRERTAEAHYTHGGCDTSEYKSWEALRQRCENPNNKKYPRYGGRGIKVCERWKDFSNFIADMGKKPTPDHTIDRIDNDGDYCPENCRWATAQQQAQNTSKTWLITYKGRVQCLIDWSRELGVPQNTLSRRIKKYGVIKAFKMKHTPRKTHEHGKLIEHDGKSMTLKQWAEELGLNFKALWARIHVSGMSFEKAIVYSRPKAKKK